MLTNLLVLGREQRQVAVMVKAGVSDLAAGAALAEASISVWRQQLSA